MGPRGPGARRVGARARRRRHGRGCRGAGGPRVRGRVPARGPPSRPTGEQGPLAVRHRLPAIGERATMAGWTPERRDLRDVPGGIEAPDPVLLRSARFSRWDGSQSVPDLAADEILDALAEDVMAEGDLASAL